MEHARITRAGEYYEVAINGLIHTFVSRQAAREYVRQCIREQKQIMEKQLTRDKA